MQQSGCIDTLCSEIDSDLTPAPGDVVCSELWYSSTFSGGTKLRQPACRVVCGQVFKQP